jgi:ELWxxDGT repeat protein
MMPNFLRRLRRKLLLVSATAGAQDRRRSSRPVRGSSIQQLEIRSLLSATAVLVEDAIPGGGIRPLADGSSLSVAYLTDVNGTLFFRANDGTNGLKLWRMNDSGIAELVEDSVAGGGIRPGALGSGPQFLTNVNGTLFFRADDGTNGLEL